MRYTLHTTGNCLARADELGVVIEVMILDRQANLLEVVGTRRSGCSFSYLLDSGKEQPNENCYNCDHNQKFNQRKGIPKSRDRITFGHFYDLRNVER